MMAYKNYITLFSMLLFLILPSTIYANDLGAAIINALVILQSTIVFSVFIAVFIKYILCKLLYSGDAKLSLKSFSLVMINELIIMSIFIYPFLYYTRKYYDMWFTSFLSYLSIDIALLYFQKIFIEHKYALSLIGQSLIFIFILSFINFIPNHKLLIKHSEKRRASKKKLLLTYLLSIIAPVLFCLIIVPLEITSRQRESRYITSDHREVLDIKEKLLKQAAINGYPRLVGAIIRKGANVKASNYFDKITVLHEAVMIPGNSETVRILLQGGANVNSRDSYDLTPLMRACLFAEDDREIIQLLLDYGADVNFQNKRGRTALMEASHANNIELVKLLLDHGADVNIKDNEDKTAYMITSDPNVKQILVNHGAKIF